MKTWKKIALGILVFVIAALGYLVYQQWFFVKMAMVPLRPYEPTQLPADTTRLFTVRGDMSEDTAYVYVQGGPNYVLFTEEFHALHYLPGSDSLLKIFPVQSQIMNRSVFAAEPTITEEQAQQEFQTSVEMIKRTIEYLKKDGKVVYVIGHSYGTTLLLEYLDRAGNRADQLVLMGYNLDMDLQNIEALKRGKIFVWKNGTEPVEQAPFPPFLKGTSMSDKFTNGSMLMLNGKKRYTQNLADDSLKNVIYVYGKYDESVGRPKQHELDFLLIKGVKIFGLEGGHMSMWSREFMGRLYSALTER